MSIQSSSRSPSQRFTHLFVCLVQYGEDLCGLDALTQRGQVARVIGVEKRDRTLQLLLHLRLAYACMSE